MGCVASREDDKQLVPATPKQDEKVKFPAELTSKPFIMNSIKRKDLILFEKTLKQNNTISLLKAEPIIQQKTLLHFIAEKDFHEGMALAIEYILQEHPDDAPQILNAKDTEGNTPLITCCYNNAWDTVKVLLKHGDLVNKLATNMSGKTAYDVALDLESPQAGLLSTRLSTGGSSSTQIDSANISTQPNQGSHHRSGSLLKVMSLKDVDLTSSLNSVDTPNALKSFKALSKDKAKSKFATRLTSLNEELKETGATSFIDNEFPHDILSLNAGLDDDTLEELYDLTWVKATDLLSSYSKIKVFGDIAVNDVSKSLLAGCDLYFALASMTEFPQRLFNVFTSNQVSNKGSYSVNFLVSGIPVEILLDDYFPCVEGSELVFSKPVKNELWFSLLEKAFAKLYGSYAHIKNISLVEALETMTGMPSTQYQLNTMNADKLWRDMLTFDHNNYIVCAGRNNDSVELNRILTVCKLSEVENMKIVKLMNHYGELRFRTSLVNNNDKWTAKVKEEVGYSIKETNCIYLELEEFLKIFDTLTVCAYNDNWTRSGLEVESEPSKPKFLKFEVEQDMDVILTVHQKLPVFLDEESDYNLSPVEVILAEQTDRGQIRGIAYGEKDALSGKQTVFASDNITVKLTKGTYVIRVKAHWVDGMSHDFSVNVFAPMPVVITETEKHNYPNFLNNLYISVGSNLERRFHLQHNCEFASAWAGSHLWVYGQNEGEKTWKLDIVIEKMTNLRRRKIDEKEENVIRLVVPPGEKVATYMKRVNCGAVELIWKFEQSWE